MNRKMGILVITLAAATAFAQTTGAGQNSGNAKALAAKQANAASASSHVQATKPSAAASAKAPSASTPVASTAAPVQKKASAPTKSTASKSVAAQSKTSSTAKTSASAAKTSAKQVSAPLVKAAPNVKATKGGEKQNAGKKEEKSDNSDQASDEKKYSMTGKRDPFLSPVVNHVGGSGCSTGKKCLEIGQIALKGVVHGEAGFIAVVTNALNKAYFLRENDPVFNGYVVKITGDSIIFKETYQDRLGKSFTREVTKKITTPAV
jgi:hypothetical protein